MNDFELKLTLRQQTPHLHFLHDQPGPPLRLTELKAKLDRLICKHHFHDEFEEAKEYLVGYSLKNEHQIKKKWKDKSEHFRALDYRLRLVFPTTDPETMWAVSTPVSKFGRTVKQESSDELLTDTPYFADNDKTNLLDEQVKKGILHKQPIQLILTCLDDQFLTVIGMYLVRLFALENFGCRQSKGFGCYWIEGHDFEQTIGQLLENNVLEGVWRGQKTFRDGSLNEIFRTVSADYRVLKTGFNNPRDSGSYRKSMLFEHFAEGNVRWEKRKIKKDIRKAGGQLLYTREPLDFADGKPERSWEDPVEYDYRFIRALLGLAEQYEFQATSGDKIKVKIEHPEVERFRSPITIKVVNGRIYWLAIAGQTEKMLDKTFEFTAEQGSTRFFQKRPIPTPSQFNLGNFLNQKLPLLKENGGYTKIH